MYVMEFVNRVRSASGMTAIEELPAAPVNGTQSSIEIALEAEFDNGWMRFSDRDRAAEVALATGRELGADGHCVEAPDELAFLGSRPAAVSSGTVTAVPVLAA